jgi:endonuclease/exonuclease/phosphatase (EEP) superfamily protein YafD
MGILMTRRACALVLAAMICAAAIYAVPSQQAIAHEFSGDESASLLALVESIKVELELVQNNLASNATLAEEHAEHAHEQLDEHIIEEISERNERLGRDLPAALEDLHMTVGNSTGQEVQTKIQNINDLLAETVSASTATS